MNNILEFPPKEIVDAAVMMAKRSPCSKSKRGVVIWDPVSREIMSRGFNSPPQSFQCDGSSRCRENCGKLCEHAEQEALRTLSGPAERLDLLHVKVVSGEPVTSGGPSCWQCSRSIARDERIVGVWLYHEYGWERYLSNEFHAITLEACGLQRDANSSNSGKEQGG